MDAVTILAFTGLARSGKDTAAARLLEHHGYRRIAFADQLRTALYALDPYVTTRGGTHSLRYLVDRHGWDQAKTVPDVRRLLQRFGTEVGRTLWGTDFWVERATTGITPADRIVFTDVRYPNEADAVHRLGGQVIEIRRPGAGLTDATGTHASEAMAFDADQVIVNDGTLEQLHAAVDALVTATGS